MLELTFILSLLNVTIIFALNKWGVFDYIHTFKPPWLKWYPECFFCYGFQLACIECVILAFFNPEYNLLLIPFLAAPLTSIFRQ